MMAFPYYYLSAKLKSDVMCYNLEGNLIRFTKLQNNSIINSCEYRRIHCIIYQPYIMMQSKIIRARSKLGSALKLELNI